MDIESQNIILQSLKDIKLIINQLCIIQSRYDNTQEEFYNIETIYSFLKLIFCRLRNTIIKQNKDEYLKFFIQNNKT
jgi:hypothetical protein